MRHARTISPRAQVAPPPPPRKPCSHRFPMPTPRTPALASLGLPARRGPWSTIRHSARDRCRSVARPGVRPRLGSQSVAMLGETGVASQAHSLQGPGQVRTDPAPRPPRDATDRSTPESPTARMAVGGRARRRRGATTEQAADAGAQGGERVDVRPWPGGWESFVQFRVAGSGTSCRDSCGTQRWRGQRSRPAFLALRWARKARWARWAGHAGGRAVAASRCRGRGRCALSGPRIATPLAVGRHGAVGHPGLGAVGADFLPHRHRERRDQLSPRSDRPAPRSRRRSARCSATRPGPPRAGGRTGASAGRASGVQRRARPALGRPGAALSGDGGGVMLERLRSWHRVRAIGVRRKCSRARNKIQTKSGAHSRAEPRCRPSA